MYKDACILFLQYPEHGKMKTRLSAEYGDDLAYDLQVCFIRDMLNTLRSIEAETIIVGTGATGKGPPGIFGRLLRLVQRGHDTGERLHNAFADVFSRGYDRAVLIGAEYPGLPTAYVRQAFAELGSHEVVLGPDNEGGYCLVGLQGQSLRPGLFRDIPWGTSRVLAATVGIVEDALMELSILEQVERINGVEGLRHLAEDRIRAAAAANTMQFLEMHREKLLGTL